jgi:hypothetical protein
MARYANRPVYKNTLSLPERTPWDSGFMSFKRRIGEQLQLGGFTDDIIEDSELLSFYRMGESETYVLSALGCAIGM